MSLTIADIPSPSLAWTFNGTLSASAGGVAMTGTPTYITGLYGQAAAVVGTAAYTTGTLPAASNITTSNGLTICVWSQITVGAPTATKVNIFQLLSGVNNTIGNTNQLLIAIGFYNGWKISYYYNDPGSGYRECDATIIAGLSNWYHLCVVFGGSANKTITFYINGVSATASSGSNPVTYTTDMTGTTAYNIVSNAGLSNNTYAVSDSRIFPFALTATQVQNIYKQNANSSIGTISRFSGGAGTSSMSSVTPGSVLAYSYLYSTVNIQGVCVGVDAGSNVYFGMATAVFSSTVFPNSFQKVPDQYYSFFPTSGNNAALLLKYNKLGKLIGMMKTSPSNQSISSITTDPGSNVYVTVSGVIGSAWNAYDIDASNPNLNAQSVPAVTNILKYSPAGKLIGWGGGLLGTAGITMQVSLDSGSNVYVCGYYRNSVTGTIYNIGTTNTVGGTLPSSVTPATAGVGSFWPAIFKWSPVGTFLGYSIIRCQNNAAACVALNAVGQSLAPDKSGNIYWGGAVGSNIYCNVNSISTTEPTTNSYSLNTTQVSATITNAGSNAFVIQFGPSGTVTKFTEIGYGPASSGTRFMAATGMGVSSSGNVYVNGNFSTNGAGSPVPLLNFGLADPKTGSFLSASSVSALATTQAAGSVILVCYNSSGVVQASSQHLVSIAFNGAPLVIDKNDNIYQFFYYTNQTFPLQNLGQTSSGITVPLPGVAANYCVAKFNSAGNVVGFSPINNTNTNLPLSMAVDSTGVYLNCRFINATGGLANVNAISTTVSRFANLPTTSTQGAAMIKWAL